MAIKNIIAADGMATTKKKYEKPEIEAIYLPETPALLSASKGGGNSSGAGIDGIYRDIDD